MGKKFHRNSLVFTLANERGIALVIGMIIMILLVVLGGIMLYVTRTEIKVTSNYEQSVQALHAAEAGAETMLQSFRQGGLDLDSVGGDDFTQVFVNNLDMGDPDNRFQVNNGTTKALVWVDVDNSTLPLKVLIHSRGEPEGTNARREVTLTLTTSAQNIIGGALNNATPAP